MTPTIRDNRRRPAPLAGGESGLALAAAMFALAVIGALVASSFFAGRLEQQSGQNVFFAGQAREAAEAGLAEAMVELDVAALEKLPPGGAPLDLGTATVGEHVTVHSQVARLTTRLLLIRAQGTRHNAAGAALATRALGLLVQLAPPGAASTTETGDGPKVTRLAERSWVRLY